MLTRLLRKRYGYEAELIDPRGWSLKGVPVRVEDFDASMADYYDLVIGLHPDEALRSVVQSAGRTATLVVPCCNFWSAETKLGRDELIEQIIDFHNQRGGKSEHIVLDFHGPKNHALILLPPADNVRLQAKEEVAAGVQAPPGRQRHRAHWVPARAGAGMSGTDPGPAPGPPR
jgi:hypothetical protein